MNPLTCSALAFAAICALPPPAADAQFQDRADHEPTRRIVGALTATQLSVRLDEVPARAAFQSLARALDVTIIGRYHDDASGHGIDPDLPITFWIDDAPALLVLEMILDQCAFDDPCTWQIRRGFIEVGTKERLSAPGAIESRVYDIRDLALEPPYYEGGMGLLYPTGILPSRPTGRSSNQLAFQRHPFKSAALKERLASPGQHVSPDELAREIVRGIVATIEPGNWDFDQDAGADENRRARRSERSDGGRAAKPPKIAGIRIWRQMLIVRAPDYIHRQIDGYPPAIIPAPLSAEQMHERSAEASSEGCTMTYRGVRRPAAPALRAGPKGGAR